MIANILEAIGAVVIGLAVVIGVGAWLLSGLKPGDMP